MTRALMQPVQPQIKGGSKRRGGRLRSRGEGGSGARDGRRTKASMDTSETQPVHNKQAPNCGGRRAIPTQSCRMARTEGMRAHESQRPRRKEPVHPRRRRRRWPLSPALSNLTADARRHTKELRRLHLDDEQTTPQRLQKPNVEQSKSKKNIIRVLAHTFI